MKHQDDPMQLFLVECQENLDALDCDKVSLATPGSSVLARLYRTIHTMRGASGLLGLKRLEALTASGEDVLTLIQDGVIIPNEENATALLSLIETVRKILASLEKNQHEGDSDHADLINTLTKLSQVTRPPESVAGATPSTVEAGAGAGEGGVRSAATEETIRVSVLLLDRLMNMVGELVLARNHLMRYKFRSDDPTFSVAMQQMDRITTELQENVMRTRLQPIGKVWSGFPRLLRDLSRGCGKQVRLDVEGQETELDKTIVEAIKDPLTHIIRNAVDHGVEDPAVRQARGKSPEGRVLLRARHEGGQVNVEISDDGAGIDPHQVRETAVQQKLITSAQAETMGDAEALNLIFVPGFSTAKRVTRVSGRGVGMDVVRTNIDKLRGTVDVLSEPGRGTTFKIRIPLTLAIIPALMVTSSGDRYAIPQVNLQELISVEVGQNRGRIESIHGTPVYRLRGGLLPLVYLDRALGISAPGSRKGDVECIVVLQAGERKFGLVVDSVSNVEEIVVKPVGKLLKDISVFAGATVMGDGRVALILDALALALHARVMSQVDHAREEKVKVSPVLASDNRQALLLFDVGPTRRMAIPLSKVARLEEIPRAAVKYVGNQKVVRYRGEILSLVELSSVFGGPVTAEDEMLHVVVYAEQGRSVGLVVSGITDIVEENVVIRSRLKGRGYLSGTAIIAGRVTDLLDVRAAIHAVNPALIENPAGAMKTA